MFWTRNSANFKVMMDETKCDTVELSKWNRKVVFYPVLEARGVCKPPQCVSDPVQLIIMNSTQALQEL